MNWGINRPIATAAGRTAPRPAGMRAALFLSSVLLLAGTLLPAACTNAAGIAAGEPRVRALTPASPLRAPGEPQVSATAQAGVERGKVFLPLAQNEALPLAEEIPLPATVAAETEDLLVALAQPVATEPGPVSPLPAPSEAASDSDGGLLAAATGAESPETAEPAVEAAVPTLDTELAAGEAATPTIPITEALAALVPSGGPAAPITPALPVAAREPPAPPPAEGPPPILATPLAELVADGVDRTVRVPVLMYHYLSVPPAGADIYRKDLSVAPDLFSAHLDRLAEEGYTTISPYQLIAALQMGAPLPDKPVLLTFDDGYRDNFENAFPRLRERGMTATFFLVTDFIDEGRPEYLSWEMARTMAAGGMTIESHGRNHTTLTGRDRDYLVWQALGSLETIQFELGTRPRFISYPAGEYDDNTLAIFQSAGYWAGFTTEQGALHSALRPFELERVRVRGTTSPDDLARLLAANW